MAREGKGSAVSRYLSDYSVLDLETTGVYVTSAEIIEVSALKVRDGVVVGEFSQLVNPKCHIPSRATAVNHITDDMVVDAPCLDTVLDDFLAFVGDDAILGYNNAGFDMNIIYDKVFSMRNLAFSNDYIDLLYVSRRVLPELENHKLETISAYYGLDTEGEHRALKDCYLTMACYEHIYKQFGEDAFVSKSYSSSGGGSKGSGQHSGFGKHYSSETKALKDLEALLQDIVADGKVTAIEFSELNQWVIDHRDLQGNYPFDRVFDAIDRVLEDGVVSPEELTELQYLFSEFLDPVKNASSHEEIKILQGKHVCVTGDFEYGSREDVSALIESAGGVMDKSVKKVTDYLVVGAHGSAAWKAGKYGSKIKKAMENIEKGTNIKIVEESEFIPYALHLIDNPIDWKTPIQKMLNKMVVEMELPDQSLSLIPNYARDKASITSYSVCIYEPDYPEVPNAKRDPKRNSVVLNIKEKRSDLELTATVNQIGDITLPEDAAVAEKPETDNMTVTISMISDNLVDYVRKNTEYCLVNYTSKASAFGCCSSFRQCSDAKKCVHINKLYSKACTYRGNLEAGRIFYGKNRNVD